MEEDEVFSVAQLLGDLVAYRSTGTGHLEFLAGLVLKFYTSFQLSFYVISHLLYVFYYISGSFR